MAVLFVLYIPIETAEEAESVVSESHLASDSENDAIDVSSTNRSRHSRDSLQKCNSRTSVGARVSGSVKSVVDYNVQECDDASSEFTKNGHAMGDVVIPGVCECDIKPTDGLLDGSQISGEGDEMGCVFHDEELTENEACDASGTEGTTQLLENDTEEGEEREGERSMASEDGIVYTTECVTLEQFLQHVLQHLNINTDVWIKTDNNNYWQVTFVVESEDCESILQRITACGFGRFADTSISLFPASLHFVNRQSSDVAVKEEANKDTRLEAEEKHEFISSIKSRLTVAQVVEEVKSHAILTFDYILLIILASMIAALGLAENSSVILVASMLVSPLMGPIMGGTFGAVIRNRDLWMLGIQNELIGLLLCLASGFLFGLVVAGVNSSGAIWGSTPMWPTAEMQSRGLARSLWVGILIAVPSGAGVALSILGGNIGSLVGVAISASLLPPAVNAGMLWACSIVSAIHDAATESEQGSLSPPACQPLPDNTYKFVYSCSMPMETAILGVVSLVLTLINIICIFLMGIFILKLKEVAPHAVPKDTEVFWKKDIKVARDTYRTIKGGTMSADLASTARQIAQEWKERHALPEINTPQSQQSPAIHDELSWQYILDAVESDSTYRSVIRHLASPHAYTLRQTSDGVTDSHHGGLSPSVFPGNAPASPNDISIEMVRLRHRSVGSSPVPSTPVGPRPTTPVGPRPTIRSSTEKLIFNFEQAPHSHLRRHRHERVRRGIERLHSCPTGIAVASAEQKTRFQVTKVQEGSEEKSSSKHDSTNTGPERRLHFQTSQTAETVTEETAM